jgi:hypothetical protein
LEGRYRELLECYHCPTARPGFGRAVDVDLDRYELQDGGMRSGLVEHGRLLSEGERLISHFQSLVRDAL